MTALSSKDHAKADRIIREFDDRLAAAWRQLVREGMVVESCALILPEDDVPFAVRPLAEVVKMLEAFGEHEAAGALRGTERVPGQVPFVLRFDTGAETATVLGWYVPDAELS
jgi:hypothetical protein